MPVVIGLIVLFVGLLAFALASAVALVVFFYVSVFFGFAMILVTIAFKAGLLSRLFFDPRSEYVSLRSIVAFAGLLSALMWIGCCGFAGAVLTLPEVAQSIMKSQNTTFKYSANPIFHFMWFEEGGGGAWIVGWRNANGGFLSFFVATVIFLFCKSLQEKCKSILGAVAVSILGAMVFGIVMHGNKIVAIMSTDGLASAFLLLTEKVVDEIRSTIDLAMSFFGVGPYKTFWGWLTSELQKMDGSLYKIGSLYPKLFLVFLVLGIGQAVTNNDHG